MALRARLRSILASSGDGLDGARRALARQSVLVGVIAAAVDVTVFSISGIFGRAPVEAAVAAALLVAVDLALGAPPRTVAAVTAAQVIVRVGACVLLYRNDVATGFGDIGILIAGYRAGAWLSDRASTVIVPILVVGVTAAAALNGAAEGSWRILLVIAVSNGIAPWLVGRYTAAGGKYVTELEQREIRQREATELALADEREAIARDLHDVISHHVSAIGIHAGAARMAIAADHDAAVRSLSAVEAASRSAMVDLRRQLDLLHGRDDAGDRQPGLANIAEVFGTARAAGLVLEADIPQDPPPLPQSLDVTVYRIVQELLTNALRHGDGTARVAVRFDHGKVVIEQSNPVAQQPYSVESTHRGVEGMRRRAELFGGNVECGMTDAQQWHATVGLPIGAP